MGRSDAERRRAGAPVDDYLAELAAGSREVLSERLVGVYAGGSLALGAYEDGRSDLDVAVVVERRLARALKGALVDALRHETLPCPARGLELVVYSREVVASGGVGADFELNLNTGREMECRVDFVFDQAIGSHWFAIDRAILHARGLAVVGPPAAEVFAKIPRSLLLPVVVESLHWHAGADALGDDAVLNAYRALRYARTSSWTSKPEAGRWALDQGVGDTRAIEAALEARRGGETVDPKTAAACVATVLREVAGGLKDP